MADNLAIENDVGVLSSVKAWLSNQYDINDLEKKLVTSLGSSFCEIARKRMLGLSQAVYIYIILSCFSMYDSKKSFSSFQRHAITRSKD